MAKKQRTLQGRIKAAAKDGRCKVRALKLTMDEGKTRQVGDEWKMLTQLVGPHVEAGIVELLD